MRAVGDEPPEKYGRDTVAEVPRSRSLWLVLPAAVVLYLLLAAYADLGEVFQAVAALPPWTVAAALAMALTNYGLRWLRWRNFMHSFGHALHWRTDLTTYLAGFAFTATPGKAGEAARALYLKPHGVPYSRAVGACVAERLLDLATVLAIAGLALFLYADYDWVVLTAAAFLMVGFAFLGRRGGLAALLTWAQMRAGPRLSAVLARGGNTAAAIPSLLHGKLLASGLMLGLVGWLAEGTGFWLLGTAAGFSLSWAQSVAIYALGLLAGALSFLPGGLVGTEIVMVGLLAAAGPEGSAVAVVLAARACTLWFSIALGFGALAALPRAGTQPSGRT